MKEFIQLFKIYLEKENGLSKVTVKNYLADVNKFFNWFYINYGRSFDSLDLTVETVSNFSNPRDNESPRSKERYVSTLRKFSSFLLYKKLISEDPFVKIRDIQNITKDIDIWRLKQFKDHLYTSGASRATIKNYNVDLEAFRTWVNKSSGNTLKPQDVTLSLINTYKERLGTVLGLSPRTINRKLSSIRRYIMFIKSQALPESGLGLTLSEDLINSASENVKLQLDPPSNLNLEDMAIKPPAPVVDPLLTSPIPPIRLLRKIASPYLLFEETAANRISNEIERRRLAKKAESLKSEDPLHDLKNLPKELYAPDQMSLSNVPIGKRFLFHIRYTRPKWYKRYHNYPISSYLHLAVLMTYASIVGVLLYNTLLASNTSKVLAQSSAPPRVLSFQGRLTDRNDSPITTPTNIRFQIYSDPTATGSGNLLWQEVDQVNPDQDGVFSLLLGSGSACAGQPLSSQNTPCAISNTLFTDNAKLYLGLTIENTQELTPRQQIASVAFAANSETLQGMRPITDSLAGGTNAILALDSSGNLTIGGSADHTFSASGGQFKISGQPLLLTTNESSNQDVIIAPDGAGRIDLRAPLVNTGQGGNVMPGSVEVDDTLVVMATESARSAFVVNNNTSGGAIFVASSSGTARFIVQNNGDLNLAAGGNIDTLSGGTLTIGGNNATTISIGRAAEGITLPAFTGQNGILYGTYGTGVLSQASTSTPNLCLLSGASAPAWSDCTSSSSLYFSQSNGLLFPNNSTVDFAIGGQSTASAKFAILNVNGSGPATATISGNLMVMPKDGAGGLVGIGTDSPQAPLHVLATTNSNVLRLQDSDGTCDHNPGAGSETVTCSSDQSLKSNINDTNDVLMDLLKYRIRTYTVNASGDLMTGVIAQEVQQNFPDKVHAGPNGLLMVELPSPWVLLKSIQELYARIAATSQNFVTEGAHIVSLTATTVEAESVKIGNLTANSLSLTNDSITVAGQSLHDYIAQIANSIINNQSPINISQIVSPLASIDEIHTNVISPLARDSNISLDLKNSKVEIRNSNQASGSAVIASIDNQGNATFSGSLTAASASVSGNLASNSLSTVDATVSGTLYADNIKAGSIEGLDEKISKSMSNAQYPVSSESANINPIFNNEYAALNTKYVDIQSISSDFATFRQGLIALGPATFGQITALESLSIGSSLTIGENSINTLGTDLEIQPLKQGAVSFLAGAVRIETDGTLKVLGNAEIAGDLRVGGKVKTNVISPLPREDLLANANNVNVEGNLIASGSGTFNKLNLSFIQPAYAVSDTEVVATSSAGLASIKPYRTELTIDNPGVTDKSLIYITPVGNTYNQVLYLLRQVPTQEDQGIQGSFTVGVDSPVSSEIQFNWIIVN